MRTKKGCGLGLHMLPYIQNAQLLKPELPINVKETLRISGSYNISSSGNLGIIQFMLIPRCLRHHEFLISWLPWKLNP